MYAAMAQMTPATKHVTLSASVNAIFDASSIGSTTAAGADRTASTVVLNDSSTAADASAGKPAGITITWRYQAPRIDPKIAMPRAAPNS